MTFPSYATTSYSSANLQRQPRETPRSGLKRLTGQRLPWGNTQDVVPDNFMTPGPSSLRHLESVRLKRDQELAKGTYKPAPLEHIDFHDRCDHEHYRHAPWSARTHFWVYVGSFGKGGFFIFLFVGAVVALLEGIASDKSFVNGFLESLEFSIFFTLLPCLAAWSLASVVIHKFPRLWAKPGKGPKWELNRRTGMITVFKYKGQEVTEQRAPFHEFDAYINTTTDRQGLPMNVLSLEHRYSDISIHFGDLQPPSPTVNQPLALWDFIQNYMDTSHPLPDAPIFEEHRRNDPTTIEHDKATRRNPRYWIDMDDETFKQAQHDMLGRVDRIDTMIRQNLMAQYVDYPL